jgi:Lon protease-like protein
MAINIAYRSPKEIPEVIPVFPLPRALLLPRAELPLNIFEPRYLQMIEDVIRGERVIGMIQPNEPEEGASQVPPLYPVGCAGRLTNFAESGDGRYQVVLTGITRFRVLEEVTVTTPYRQCKVDYTIFGEDLVQGLGEDEVDREALLKRSPTISPRTRSKLTGRELRRRRPRRL